MVNWLETETTSFSAEDQDLLIQLLKLFKQQGISYLDLLARIGRKVAHPSYIQDLVRLRLVTERQADLMLQVFLRSHCSELNDKSRPAILFAVKMLSPKRRNFSMGKNGDALLHLLLPQMTAEDSEFLTQLLSLGLPVDQRNNRDSYPGQLASDSAIRDVIRNFEQNGVAAFAVPVAARVDEMGKGEDECLPEAVAVPAEDSGGGGGGASGAGYIDAEEGKRRNTADGVDWDNDDGKMITFVYHHLFDRKGLFGVFNRRGSVSTLSAMSKLFVNPRDKMGLVLRLYYASQAGNKAYFMAFAGRIFPRVPVERLASLFDQIGRTPETNPEWDGSGSDPVERAGLLFKRRERVPSTNPAAAAGADLVSLSGQ